MIEWLALENFRSFGDRSLARFAPVTLVYGPNSAGKSSLVKSLLFLKQSALAPSASSFRYDGPFVDLGSARAVSHRHLVGKQVGIEVGLGEVVFGRLRAEISVHFSIGVEREVDDRVAIGFAWKDGSATVAFRRAGKAGEYLRLADQQAASQFHEVMRNFTRRDDALFYEDSTEHHLLLAFAVDSLIPSRTIGRFTSPRSSTLAALADAELSPDERLWNQLADRITAEFRRSMTDISYLGPLRRPLSRMEPVLPDRHVQGVGPSGEHSVNLLHRHGDLLRRVNDALDLLEMGYSLSVEKLDEGPGDGVSGLLPDYLVPVLRHVQSGIAISPADAGFGLSQLLPLLVETELRKQSLICIEQPELHLHPRLQARFGSVLRKAVQGSNRNRYLIETHSEHLLLRLQSLVRQGLLSSSSVVVLYVDNQDFDEGADRFFQSLSSEILTLRISSTGELLDPWPGGFFDERWDELRGNSRGGRDG